MSFDPFKGLLDRSGRDLSEALSEAYSDADEIIVHREVFETIALRIEGLTILATQGAMVQGMPEHAGWGIPAGFTPEPEPEESAPDDSIPCSSPVCDGYAVAAGENVYQCLRGHLTIARTP